MPLHELNGLFMLVFISRTHWDSNTPPPRYEAYEQGKHKPAFSAGSSAE